ALVTLALHDALPISRLRYCRDRWHYVNGVIHDTYYVEQRLVRFWSGTHVEHCLCNSSDVGRHRWGHCATLYRRIETHEIQILSNRCTYRYAGKDEGIYSELYQ